MIALLVDSTRPNRYQFGECECACSPASGGFDGQEEAGCRRRGSASGVLDGSVRQFRHGRRSVRQRTLPRLLYEKLLRLLWLPQAVAVLSTLPRLRASSLEGLKSLRFLW